tara:strand:+ start:17422 stop:17928 length:507 start_codon:yes stop_codon:yes gene_type:complete
MRLNSVVAQIISAPNFDRFTTSDVRSAYFALKNDPSLESASVRRHIYAELLKLVKKGWLKKPVSHKKGFTRFHKTDLFDYDEIALLAGDNVTNLVTAEDEKKDKLLAKLNHYKAELLLNIGESEAYKELYSECPELVNEIQPQFNSARDNNTRILGKIRAIEGLLAQD